jgi:hypothetical protein
MRADQQRRLVAPLCAPQFGARAKYAQVGPGFELVLPGR